MSFTKKSTSAKLVRAGAVTALALTGVVAVAGASDAAVLSMTSNITTGAPAGGNVIVLTLNATATTPASNKFSNGALFIQFQAVTGSNTQASTACADHPILNVAANLGASPPVVGVLAGREYGNVATMRYLSPTKVTVAVPALNTALAPNLWIVCAYNEASATSTTSSPIGKASYTTVAAPTFTSINTYTNADAAHGPGAAVVSNSNPDATGPSAGGTTITVAGSNFATGMTVLLGATITGGTGGGSAPFVTTGASSVSGGTPMQQVVVANGGASFTAVAPPKVGSDLSLTVVTQGGNLTILHAYSSLNGISVSPSSAALPATGAGPAPDIDVQGAGFNSLVFGASGVPPTAPTGGNQDDTYAHVFLVQGGAYDATGYVAASLAKVNPQVADCSNVFVISDTELICTLDTSKHASVAVDSTTHASTWSYLATSGSTNNIPKGAYTLTVVNSAAADPTYQTVISGSSTFTVGAF